jgi:uncharacterized membrane protein YfcA
MLTTCLSCILACVFLFYMMYTTFQTRKNEIMTQFETILSKSEKHIYYKIVQERSTIYNQGFAIGLVSSLILLWGSSLGVRYGMKSFQIINNLNKANKLCTGVVVTFLVTYGYYLLSKKSDYMILHLNEKEKREKWLEVYKYMQRQHHLGFLYGLIGVGFLSIMF